MLLKDLGVDQRRQNNADALRGPSFKNDFHVQRGVRFSADRTGSPSPAVMQPSASRRPGPPHPRRADRAAQRRSKSRGGSRCRIWIAAAVREAVAARRRTGRLDRVHRSGQGWMRATCRGVSDWRCAGRGRSPWSVPPSTLRVAARPGHGVFRRSQSLKTGHLATCRSCGAVPSGCSRRGLARFALCLAPYLGRAPGFCVSEDAVLGRWPQRRSAP